MKPWLTYDFPLRGNAEMAQLVLPSNMTHLEAERICAFVMTLAVDWKREDSIKGAA